MEFMAFIEEVRKEIQKRKGSEYQIEVQSTLKNNNVERHGICFRKIDSVLAPTVYLDEFRQKIEEGKITVEEVVNHLMDTAKEAMEEAKEIPIDCTFEGCKDRIVYRLVNMKKNETMLENIMHIPFLDLALMFDVVMSQEDGCVSSMHITKALARKWNVNENDLYELAKVNTIRLFPPKCTNLFELLAQKYDLSEEIDCDPWMYVVTNASCINGAAAICYPGLLKYIADEMDSDLYILPSSTHECIVIPLEMAEGEDVEDELGEMIRTINHEVVREEEILSSHPYRYHRAADKISLMVPDATYRLEVTL